MKYLIYIAILGFVTWIVSELIEIVEGGYNSTVYYLTSVYHIFAGFGIWGLHLLQSQKKNTISLISVVLISLTYFSLGYFPIQVMNAGLSISEFIIQNPLYKIPGIISLIGFVLFGYAIIRTKYFPNWTGLVLIFGTIIYAISMALEFQIVVNINNIILSGTIIYMCFYGLKKIKISTNNRYN